MRSMKTYLVAFLLVFFLSIPISRAQTRVHKLYSRSVINGVKQSDPTKKITIQVYGKDHEALKDSYIKIVGAELEFEANENGEILVELPGTWKDENVELKIYGKNHYSKSVKVSFEDFEEVYRIIKLKKIIRIGGCPSF